MDVINQQEDLIAYFGINPPDVKNHFTGLLENLLHVDRHNINNCNISKLIFSQFSFGYNNVEKVNFQLIEFGNCLFESVIFIDVNFSLCQLTTCTFLRCTFINTTFSKSHLNSCHFNECDIISLIIEGGNVYYSEFQRNYINTIKCINTAIVKCELNNNRPDNRNKKSPYFLFIDSILNSSLISFESHIEYSFVNTKIIANSFVSSVLKNHFFADVTCDSPNYIDLQSLSISEKLNSKILKELFNINGDDIQVYVSDCFLEIKYETVFISFSFKNIDFARQLSQSLLLKGVKTWFWPEDAPGGKRTKDIMYKGIQENERVIFICSEDSLKSVACHYELSEARKKEGQLWKEILFPIAIDKSVFDEDFIRNIRKYKKDVADEWIANIEWLKEYNVLDFSVFIDSKYNADNFNKAINNLVADLRKPIEKT